MEASASVTIADRLAKKRAEMATYEAQAEIIARRIEILSAEISAWDEALRIISGSKAPVSVANSVPLSASEHAPNDKRRGPRGSWRRIMPEMVRQYPTGEFSVDDVVAAGEMISAPVQRATCRSQLANYVNSGWLDRVVDGRFRFTKVGLDALADLSNSPGDADSAPETETPAAGDAQAAGASSENVHGVVPEASNVSQHTVGEP